MALSIISRYCTLVILLEVELTVGDELETFYEINYKNDKVLVFTLF
jgi:hypothetical protein